MMRKAEVFVRGPRAWPALIERSFLNPKLKAEYLDLVKERAGRVWTGKKELKRLACQKGLPQSGLMAVRLHE